MQDNARRVALFRDELTAWVLAMDPSKTKGRGSDRQFYLAAWAVFFFQAADSIRDWSVTGVQTCALPICSPTVATACRVVRRGGVAGAAPTGGGDVREPEPSGADGGAHRSGGTRRRRDDPPPSRSADRSEERRVGKEWRWRVSPSAGR